MRRGRADADAREGGDVVEGTYRKGCGQGTSGKRRVTGAVEVKREKDGRVGQGEIHEGDEDDVNAEEEEEGSNKREGKGQSLRWRRWNGGGDAPCRAAR